MVYTRSISVKGGFNTFERASHLTQVYVAIGRFAMAVHPQSQQQGQREDAQRQQRVHEHVEQGWHSRGRSDFHCREEENY